MNDNTKEARDRLVTAALRLAAAERGGLDADDAEVETQRAIVILNSAVEDYGRVTSGHPRPEEPMQEREYEGDAVPSSEAEAQAFKDRAAGQPFPTPVDEPYGDGHPTL